MNRRGFSFVDVLIGMTLLVFTILLGVVGFQTVAQNRLSIQVSATANNLLGRTLEDLNRLCVSNFNDLDMTDDPKFTRPNGFDANTKDFPYEIRTTIEGIASDRTRRYTINVLYKGSRPRTFTWNGFLSQKRGKIGGGSIQIQVKDTLNNPIKNAYASVDANDGGPKVTGFSDDQGNLKLDGVRVGVNVPITIDGSYAGMYYFAADATHAASFTRTYTATILAGMTFTLPIVLTPPDKYTVTVINKINNNPVPGARILLYGKDLLIPMTVNGWVATTDATGSTVYTVLPGKYSPFNLGTNHTTDAIKFAATATPGDLTNKVYDTVTQGSLLTRTIYTIPSGRASGNVYTVKFDGSNLANLKYFVDNGVVPPSQTVKMMIVRTQTNGFDDSVPGTTFNYLNTVAWTGSSQYSQKYACYEYQTGLANTQCGPNYGGDPGYMMLENRTPNNGPSGYVANLVSPISVNSDLTTYAHQYNKGYESINSSSQRPLLPVLVMGNFDWSGSAPAASVQFNTRFYNTFLEGLLPPKYNAGVFDSTDRINRLTNLSVSFYANQNTPMDYYVLHESVLSNIKGKILKDGVPTSFNSARVFTTFGPNGYGVALLSGTTWRMVDSYSKDVSGSTTFDMIGPGNQPAFLPSLYETWSGANSKTQLGFTAYNINTANINFTGNMIFKDKIIDTDGTTIRIRTYAPADTNANGVNVNFGYYNIDNNPTNLLTASVNVSNGVFTYLINNAPATGSNFAGSSNKFEVPAGTTLDGNVNPDVNITAVANGDSQFRYYAGPASSQSVPWIGSPNAPYYNFFNFTDATHYDMPSDTNLVMIRKTLIRVYGYVVDQSGNPITNAHVTIYTTVNRTTSVNTVSNPNTDACPTCTDTTGFTNPPAGFQYKADNVPWDAVSDPNLYGLVSAAGFVTTEMPSSIHLWSDNLHTGQSLTSVQVNFIMPRQPAGGGGGGPGF